MSDFIPLRVFFEECFVPLNNLALPVKQAHRDLCDQLQAAVLGQSNYQFVVVNIPPRVGKTKIMEALCCWFLAYFPDAQILYLSYSNDLAMESVRYIQTTMTSMWYQELFDTRLGAVQKADYFTTTRGGRVYGDGTLGSITGRGGGLKRPAGGFIIMDDPQKPGEGESKVKTQALHSWMETTLKNRRNSDMYCPIICCQQRVSTEDLSGLLLGNELYARSLLHVKIPALVDGKSIIPETVSTETLLATMELNKFVFSAQYQQEPMLAGGNLFKIDNFKRFDPREDLRYDMKILTCDTALKTKEVNDFSVIQCWGRFRKQAYLIDQVRGKWPPSEFQRVARIFFKKHHVPRSPVSHLLVEEHQGGVELIGAMRKLGIPCKGFRPLHDKVNRAKNVEPFVASGMVYIPREGPHAPPWLRDFEYELLQFREDGHSKHDDQVDCLSSGLGALLGKGTSILTTIANNLKARTFWQ